MLVDQRRSCPGPHRVTVLGSFSATCDGHPVPLEADARRVVAYLAVHRRAQRRTALAADLWPGVPGAAALLDDALGHSDPQRLRRLASAITTAGERTQVIVLTSNPERFVNLREAHRMEM